MTIGTIQIKYRKAIRKKIVELLKDKTDVGKKVFPNASVTKAQEELPLILIYPRTETAEEFAETPRELKRTITMAIEVVASGPEVDEEGNAPKDKKTLEDCLDDIAEQIECELAIDDTLGSACDKSILTSTEFEFDGNGASPVGSVRLSYDVTYFRRSPDDLKAQLDKLPDHTTAETEWNIGEDPDTREAKDTIDVT